MLGLANLGVLHTAIALIALAAAAVCFFRDAGAFFLVFLIGAAYQVWSALSAHKSAAPPSTETVRIDKPLPQISSLPAGMWPQQAPKTLIQLDAQYWHTLCL